MRVGDNRTLEPQPRVTTDRPIMGLKVGSCWKVDSHSSHHALYPARSRRSPQPSTNKKRPDPFGSTARFESNLRGTYVRLAVGAEDRAVLAVNALYERALKSSGVAVDMNVVADKGHFFDTPPLSASALSWIAPKDAQLLSGNPLTLVFPLLVSEVPFCADAIDKTRIATISVKLEGPNAKFSTKNADKLTIVDPVFMGENSLVSIDDSAVSNVKGFSSPKSFSRNGHEWEEDLRAVSASALGTPLSIRRFWNSRVLLVYGTKDSREIPFLRARAEQIQRLRRGTLVGAISGEPLAIKSDVDVNYDDLKRYNIYLIGDVAAGTTIAKEVASVLAICEAQMEGLTNTIAPGTARGFRCVIQMGSIDGRSVCWETGNTRACFSGSPLDGQPFQYVATDYSLGYPLILNAGFIK